MNASVYLIISSVLMATGVAALVWRHNATSKKARGGFLRLALGMFGSTAIIWTVWALSGALELVAILVSIAYLAKVLAYGPSSPRLRTAWNKLG